MANKLRKITWKFLRSNHWIAFLYTIISEPVHIFVSWRYRLIPFEQTAHYNCIINSLTEVELVSVAFNNEYAIDYQIKLIKKYLPAAYNLTIADNSSNTEKASAIARLCENHGVGYIKLPTNPYRNANLSHSMALNWLYYNYIYRKRPKVFGFLDHDVFPTEPFVLPDLNDSYPLYGFLQERTFGKYYYWYLWPGFCFFDTKFLAGKKINFSSISIPHLDRITGMDTGGGNWKPVYSKIDKKVVKLAKHHYELLNDFPDANGRPLEYTGDYFSTCARLGTNTLGPQDNLVEFMDGWLHLRRASSRSRLDSAPAITRLLDSYVNR